MEQRLFVTAAWLMVDVMVVAWCKIVQCVNRQNDSFQHILSSTAMQWLATMSSSHPVFTSPRFPLIPHIHKHMHLAPVHSSAFIVIIRICNIVA